MNLSPLGVPLAAGVALAQAAIVLLSAPIE